jgi:hypothetical protein
MPDYKVIIRAEYTIIDSRTAREAAEEALKTSAFPASLTIRVEAETDA